MRKTKSEDSRPHTQWGARGKQILGVGGLQKPQRKKSFGVASSESLAETQLYQQWQDIGGGLRTRGGYPSKMRMPKKKTYL